MMADSRIHSRTQTSVVLDEILDRLGRPAIGILDACEIEALPGEDLFRTARRVLLYEALARERSQVAAADRLRTSKRIVNRDCRLHGVTPKQLARWSA